MILPIPIIPKICFKVSKNYLEKMIFKFMVILEYQLGPLGLLLRSSHLQEGR